MKLKCPIDLFLRSITLVLDPSFSLIPIYILPSLYLWFKLSISMILVICAELMILGFISLLLTFGQNYIIKICIPEKAADTMLPCRLKQEEVETEEDEDHHRRLLLGAYREMSLKHRILKEDSPVSGCSEVSL